MTINPNMAHEIPVKENYIVVDNQPSNILKLENSDTDEKKSQKLILNGMARDNFQRNNLILEKFLKFSLKLM